MSNFKINAETLEFREMIDVFRHLGKHSKLILGVFISVKKTIIFTQYTDKIKNKIEICTCFPLFVIVSYAITKFICKHFWTHYGCELFIPMLSFV